MKLLTGFRVELISRILFIGENANYDGIVAVLYELLHLLHGLDLLRWRPRLLSHVFHDA